ncbi:aldolase [Bacillus cereus]|uniref:aldolase n=1 Tax=Bacillus sp. AW TaxID=2293329 RepID=UPI000BF9D574|nr:aldolase [Bacillus wiedmannii]PFM85034.1 aldolase [Bacillus cereus]RFB68380.1 aldolase [Bacillus sp. AW]PFQ87879.1 aldolase [Bacillus cereus]PGP33668.1 aldolase [Bacillus cereus]
MLITQKETVYQAFGLSVVSDIPLPELSFVNNKLDTIDVEIRIEDLSKAWSDVSDQQSTFIVNKNTVMFQVPNIVTFSVQGGEKIIVSPMEGYEEDMIRLWILGTCMGVILMQRKIIPLHGSAVVINGKAYAFIGYSGAGKSTLASGFIKEGYQFLSDDVIAISFSQETSAPIVIPSYPQQKLWQDSLANFGMEIGEYQSICGREEKYSVPVTSQYFSEILPLAGIFELGKTESEEIEVQKIENLERFYTLFRHTFRNFLIHDLGLTEWHFRQSADILSKVDMYQLCRPISRFSAPQLVDVIINTINKGE